MKTIGPLVIEIASVENPGESTLPIHLPTYNVLKGDRESSQIQESSLAPSSVEVVASYGDFEM